jgi:hypothetical protein
VIFFFKKFETHKIFAILSDMKTLLVIVSKNQQQYAEKMNEALGNLSVQPDGVLVILERPSPAEINISKRAYTNPLVTIIVSSSLPKFIGRPQMNFHVPYFCAAHARNLGVYYAIEHSYEAIIFIDGDCFPEVDLVKSHKQLLESDDPTITVGRRCEAKYAWHDQREKDDIYPIPIFNKPGRITREAFFVDSGVVWTCNMGINRKALDLLISTNKTLYGREELCSSDFCGTWGGEDGFIGLEALYLDITVLPICEANSGVRHNEHPRPLDKYDHETFIKYLEEKREELIYLMQANGIPCPRFMPKDIIVGNREWIKK